MVILKLLMKWSGFELTLHTMTRKGVRPPIQREGQGKSAPVHHGDETQKEENTAPMAEEGATALQKKKAGSVYEHVTHALYLFTVTYPVLPFLLTLLYLRSALYGVFVYDDCELL